MSCVCVYERPSGGGEKLRNELKASWFLVWHRVGVCPVYKMTQFGLLWNNEGGASGKKDFILSG